MLTQIKYKLELSMFGQVPIIDFGKVYLKTGHKTNLFEKSAQIYDFCKNSQ